jgi:formylglycine-generating enzyme required for sulfatase activity
VPGGVPFPTEVDDLGTPAAVANAYEIGETAVTYELWYTVREWAVINGYTFDNNPGREGSSAGSNNTMPGTNKQEPVTDVTWYDAVVWLNALTEWVNAKEGKSLTPVYYYESGCTTVAKNSNPLSNFVTEGGDTHASAYEKTGATGFRLPSSDEWELAARWRNDSTNTVSGYSDPWFTTGNSASGATAITDNTAATGDMAWYDSNASGKTHAVKGKDANGLGLYDMSGNVIEWCFDWLPSDEGSSRIVRSGGWSNPAINMKMGDVYNFVPDSRYDNGGFRPARTAE